MLRKSSSKAGSRGGDEPSTPEEEQVKVRILASLICVFGPSREIGGGCQILTYGMIDRETHLLYVNPSLSVTSCRWV